ncbi:MAG TPA: hypothetical protein VGI40_21035 [Pirellulaceae bacterium]|jgi:hypothetical protein
MWLLESPYTIVALGVALIFAIGAAWTATGRQELLYALAAAIVLLFAGLLTERLIVTDREQIRATLQEIARDVKNNDHRRIISHIHSSATAIKQKAQAELPKYHFTEFRITKIHSIDVDRSADPPSAVVELNVVGGITIRDQGFESDHVARWVKLHLLKEKDGRWTVADYEHDDPQRMIMQNPGER